MIEYDAKAGYNECKANIRNNEHGVPFVGAVIGNAEFFITN